MMTRLLFLPLAVLALSGQAAPPRATPDVELRRIDCGQLVDQDLASYNDTMALDGRRETLVVPCYLIRHGRDWMVWDAGLPRRYLGVRPVPPDGATLAAPVERALAGLHLTPADIRYVGISHYHWDHSGQLPVFDRSELLIGKADWDVVKGSGDWPGLERNLFAPWTGGRGKVKPVSGDHDVFGDGSVVILALPGHTPGHQGLLVRLPRSGALLLTGDLAHTASNYREDGVPTFNTDRADTLASLARFKAIARNLKARVVIEHVAADVAKLPRFPEPAR